MKYYNVTEPEMSELSTLGSFTSLFLSLATFLFGMSWDVGVALSDVAMSPVHRAFVSGIQWPILAGAAICLLLSFGLMFQHSKKGSQIRGATDFS